jgi:hypothetical protein
VSSFIVATMIGLLEIPRPGTNAYLWPACAWITERSDDGAPWTAVGTVRTRADRPRAGRARGGRRRGRDAPIVVWLQGRRAAHDLRCPSKSAQEGRPASKSTDGDGRSDHDAPAALHGHARRPDQSAAPAAARLPISLVRGTRGVRVARIG